MSEWKLQDAKSKFSELVNDALAGEPQHVTRRGKPAVVVLAVDEYERMRRMERADCQGRSKNMPAGCRCLGIPSTLTAERKCPHDGECDIDAARTGKTSGPQQLVGGSYDDGAGSDTYGTEHTPYQAHTGGIQ